MAELLLILSITFVAIIAALAIARWVIAQSLPDSIADRLPAAVRRATGRFSRRQAARAVLSALGVGGLSLALAAATSLFGSAEASPVPWHELQLGVLGLLTGAGLSVGAHQLATRLAIRCSSSVASVAQDAGADAASTALHGGVAIAALGEVLSLGCGAGLFAWASQGAPTAASRALLAGLALGALVAAMFCQITGTALHAAGQVGRRQSRVGNDPFPYQLDPRNPSLVLDGTGIHLGVCANRALDAFCASLLCTLATVSLTLGAVGAASQERALTLLGWTLVVRSIGLLAAVVTTLLTRSADVDGTLRALWRAQIAVALLNCSGILGASRWLFPEELTVTVASCAALGLLMATGLVITSRRSFERRSRRVRDKRDNSAYLLPLTVSDGASGAVRDAGIPMLVLCAGVGAAWYLGSQSHAAFEAVLALDVGFVVGLPFYAGLTLFDPIVDAACGLASLSAAHSRPEFQSRIATLNTAASAAGSASQGYFIILSGLLGLTFALGFPSSLWPTLLAGDSAAFGGGVAPLSLFAGMLGVALVLVYSSLGVRHVAEVTRACSTSLSDEVGTLRTFDTGPITFPADYRPRYGDLLDQAFDRAFRGVVWYVLGAITLPILGLLLIRAGGGSPELLAPVLMSFLAFATVTGISVGLITEGTWSLLSATRRQYRSEDQSQLGALSLAESIAEFAGNTVSPTAQFIVKGAIAVCLTAAPALL